MLEYAQLTMPREKVGGPHTHMPTSNHGTLGLEFVS